MKSDILNVIAQSGLPIVANVGRDGRPKVPLARNNPAWSVDAPRGFNVQRVLANGTAFNRSNAPELKVCHVRCAPSDGQLEAHELLQSAYDDRCVQVHLTNSQA
jgi:hypothetical protein